MTLFQDLPPELIPVIVEKVTKPAHLALLCLVSHEFYSFTTPVLYARIFVYPWQKEVKLRVVKLFRTLADVPKLARYVQRLEVRDFPKALKTEEHTALLTSCVDGLTNCVNLRTCTWTRDGALSSEVLFTLRKLPKLQSLTINGHSADYYDPNLLVGFSHLTDVSIIMADATVLRVLACWIREHGQKLRNLTLICKASNLITDDYLQSLAPSLAYLENLNLTGCPRVTHCGITTVLAQNVSGIIGLGLEGLSPSFDILALNEYSKRHSSFTRLHSLTITTPTNFATGLAIWCKKLVTLVADAPLQKLHVYSRSDTRNQMLPDEFCAAIAYAHQKTLMRFSVHRIGVSLEGIRLVCHFCYKLEELFVVVDKLSLNRLGTSLAPAPRLRTVHVNFASDVAADDETGYKHWQRTAALIVRQGGPGIRQFGCNTRVWQVDRVVIKNELGEEVVEPRLGPFEFPDVPEQFLVVRT